MANMKELNNAEAVIPVILPFNLPIWLVEETPGSWRMTLDYYKLNQVVIPTAATVINV